MDKSSYSNTPIRDLVNMPIGQLIRLRRADIEVARRDRWIALIGGILIGHFLLK